MDTQTIINIDKIVSELRDQINRLKKRRYKVYEVLMEQTDTNAPTVKVLENTLGNIVWTRDAVGQYIGTLAGAFPENKCWFSAITASSYGNTTDGISFGRVNDNSIYLTGYTAGNSNDFNTAGVYEVSLLIKVYY